MNKSELSRLAKKISLQIDQWLDTGNNLNIVIGVSGGPDSMALLFLLDELDITLTVAHVNYLTRGKDSNADEELVRNVADELNLPVKVYHADPAERENKNFQAWARDIRFSFFRKIKKDADANYIATAHHRDDQIETILMKILRGAGPSAWQGMAILDDVIFRPLLNTSKQEILNYLNVNDIPFRVDKSNKTPHYARNLLRLTLIPRLHELLPGWDENIMKLPGYGRQFENSIKAILNLLKIGDDTLDYHDLIKLENDLCRSVILEWVKQQLPDRRISGSALKEIENLSKLQTGQQIQLSDSVRLVRNRNELKISQISDGKSFSHVIINRQELVERDSKIINDVEITMESFNNPDFTSCLYLRENALEFPLTVRIWKEGDSFQPFGMKGHQKISDHLTNRKIPTLEKKKVYVIETFDETICAVIFPAIKNNSGQPGTIDHKFRCLAKNELCVKISHW